VTRALDHLVVAARTLEEGARWLEERLGVPLAPGGRHALMGTHNRLLSLGPDAYLEVIAIDPGAPPPDRPRWYALDDPSMQGLLARGPALVHWVERVDDIEQALRDDPQGAEVLDVERGTLRWRIGVPRDGSLPGGGAAATLIEWKGMRPTQLLPPSGCTLVALRREGHAVLRTPGGERMLPWRLPE